MPHPRPAVKGLIEEDGQYLLLEQSTGSSYLWTLPGGKIEFGESSGDALEREVKEEVNLEVNAGGPVGICDFQFADTHIVVTVLDCLSDSQAVDITSNPADEIICSYEWVALSRISSRSINDGLAALLDSL